MFNEYKTTNLVCNLLKRFDEPVNYTKIIKILYLIDRKMIEENDQIITWDRYVSMKRGPVLSNTLNLIKEQLSQSDEFGYWERFIRTDKFEISLYNENENIDEFTPHEMSVIDSVYDFAKDMSYTDLIEYTHNSENCPEWQDPSPYGVLELPLSRILRFLNKDENVYNALVNRSMASSLDVF